MKLKSALTLSLLALGTATAIQAQEVKLNIPGQPAAPAAAAPAAAAAAPVFTEAQLVEEFGWFMGKRVGLSELGFSPLKSKRSSRAWVPPFPAKILPTTFRRSVQRWTNS